MSIEVRVNTSVSPLWTCIKVLYDHILCTECSLFFCNRSCSALSVSSTYSVFKLSIKLFFSICCYPAKRVVSVKLLHTHSFTW